MKVVPLLETDLLLARKRLILEKLLIHFEGLLPGTEASTEAALQIARELVAIRGLEETILNSFSAGKAQCTRRAYQSE